MNKKYVKYLDSIEDAKMQILKLIGQVFEIEDLLKKRVENEFTIAHLATKMQLYRFTLFLVEQFNFDVDFSQKYCK